MTDKSALFARHVRPIEPLPTGVSPRLSSRRRFAAILFDVYGTLLVSAAGEIGTLAAEGRETADLAALLRRHGIDRPPNSLWPALRQAIDMAHAAARRRGVDHPEVDIVSIWQTVLGLKARAQAAEFALEFELIVNPVYPMPGLQALLSACREAAVPLGIISNAQFYTPLVLAQFLGRTLDRAGFNERLIFLSYRCGYAKPSRFMFEQAAETLRAIGIATESALYVGNDMRNDILPAAGVGFRTALFAGDRRSLRLRGKDPRCRSLSPDLVVTDLRQLLVAVSKVPLDVTGFTAEPQRPQRKAERKI
jgi:putative hydrolase of the HAD superfamily